MLCNEAERPPQSGRLSDSQRPTRRLRQPCRFMMPWRVVSHVVSRTLPPRDRVIRIAAASTKSNGSTPQQPATQRTARKLAETAFESSMPCTSGHVPTRSRWRLSRGMGGKGLTRGWTDLPCNTWCRVSLPATPQLPSSPPPPLRVSCTTALLRGSSHTPTTLVKCSPSAISFLVVA